MAENTDLVFEGCRITDEFAFIKHFIDFFHNFVADFNSDTDVNNARCVGDIVLCTHLFKPFCTTSACCDDGLFCVDFFSYAVDCHVCTLANVVFKDNIVAFCTEEHINTVVEKILFKTIIDLLCLFSAHMTDGTIHKFQTCFDSLFTDFLHLFFVAKAFDMLVCTKFKIDVVGILDEFLCKISADKFRKCTAYFLRK